MIKEAIRIKSLRKEYKDGYSQVKLALDDLDLTIKKGTIFGLLGPNGAGKSTLINILAGTVVKTSGEVEIGGVSIGEYPKKARSLIGIVPQEISFDTFFPIYQALEFYAGYYGIRPKERKTAEILKALSLWDKKDSFPQRLSGGMKRRFLIAKAMVHSPEIIVLDEPTAGVDLELRTQLWEYVRELNNRGVTIILTTHYLEEAQEMCNEIAFINNGKIVKQSSKADLLAEFGKRNLEIEFYEPVKLDKQEEGRGFTIVNNNKVYFEIDRKKANYSQILKQIDEFGLAIKDIKISEPDLTDIFYQIMKK